MMERKVESERRKHPRVAVFSHIFFNVLYNQKDYLRGGNALLKKLVDIDSILLQKGEENLAISRVDKKLSMLVAMLSENHVQKSYNYQGILIDFSANGLAVGFNENVPIGALFEFFLDISNTKMDVSGKVVYCKMQENRTGRNFYILGVEFTSILEEDKKVIEKYMEDNPKDIAD